MKLHQVPTLIGLIAIMDMPDNPTLFYAMHPDYRDRGYMKDGLGCVTKSMCENNLCTTLHTEVHHSNYKSQNLLNEVGFMQCRKDDTKVYFTLFLQKS